MNAVGSTEISSLPASGRLRVSVELGADASLVIASITTMRIGNAAVVSPDGSQLAFVAQPHAGGASRLYVRRLDQLTATPLAETENAGPSLSPDGQWLGFFGGGTLKIAITGRANRLSQLLASGASVAAALASAHRNRQERSTRKRPRCLPAEASSVRRCT